MVAARPAFGHVPGLPERDGVSAGSTVAALAAWVAIRDAHYREVQSLWHAGLLAREIAARMDTTPRTVNCWLHRMRRDGWDVPYRRPDLASKCPRGPGREPRPRRAVRGRRLSSLPAWGSPPTTSTTKEA
jgi:hypothetical protein